MVKGFGSKLNKVLKLNDKINELTSDRTEALIDLRIEVPSTNIEGIAFSARFITYDPASPFYCSGLGSPTRKIAFSIDVLELVDRQDKAPAYELTMSDRSSVYKMSAAALVEYAEFRKDITDICSKFDISERGSN